VTDITQTYQLFLQIGAVLGIVSTAVYLYIALKNYARERRNEMEAASKANEIKLENVKTEVIEKVSAKISGLQDQIKSKAEQISELKTKFDDIEGQVRVIDKKCVEYDIKLPEIEKVKADIEEVKNILVNKSREILSGR